MTEETGTPAEEAGDTSAEEEPLPETRPDVAVDDVGEDEPSGEDDGTSGIEEEDAADG